MEVTTIILVSVAILLILVSIIDVVLSRKKNKQVPARVVQPLSYADCLAILNQVIEETIEERKFVLSFNEKNTVPPLDKELIYLTNRVFDSLSDDLLYNLKRYVTTEFITRYISRVARDFCMRYIEEARFKDSK